MTTSEKARSYFRSYNCAQAILAACQDLTGLGEEQSLAVAGCFGGGMRHGGTCGAVTGGLMALGLIFPYTDRSSVEQSTKISKMSIEFQLRFEQEMHAIDCNILLSGDKQGARETVCTKALTIAADLVEQMAKEFK